MKRFFFILLSVMSLDVYANNCGGEFQAATGTCRIIGSDGKEILYNSAPPQSGNSSPSQSKKIIRHTTVNIPSKYGALALSEKGGYIGGALNKDSKREAMRSAKAECEKGSNGHSCEVIIAVRNGCVAAAIGTLGKKTVVTKAAEKQGLTENVALNRCQKTGAKNCQIIMPEGCSIP